jgi:hypothetical protein
VIGGEKMKHLLLICISLGTAQTACSGLLNSNSPESVTVKQNATTASSADKSSANVASVQFGIHSADKSFPKTQDSPPEYIDSLDWLAACRTVGCSIAHTGGHNLNWFVTRAQADTGRAYYVKGEDTRCWERLDWDSKSIQITYDNCWWTPGYKYSRYADGRWLARIWKPGDSIVTDHTVYGGNWDSCTDVPIGAGRQRVMTFLWRVKDYDWGPAGRLDTIAVRQSYPDQPFIREHYIYARGYGLIAWNYENDKNPAEFNSNVFNQVSNLKPVPSGTKCVEVEKVQPIASTTNPLPDKTTVATPPASNSTSPMATPQNAPSTSPTASSPACTLTTFNAGYQFVSNQPVYSCSKGHSLVFQADGNLVLYNTRTSSAIWSSATGQSGANVAVFQNDGNLVVYRNGTPLWNSNTGGKTGATMILQDDGNLVIRLQEQPLWSSMTGGK